MKNVKYLTLAGKHLDPNIVPPSIVIEHINFENTRKINIAGATIDSKNVVFGAPLLITNAISKNTLCSLSKSFKKHVGSLAGDYEILPHPRDIHQIESSHFETSNITKCVLPVPTETAIQNGGLKLASAYFYSNSSLLYSLPLIDDEIQLYFIHTSADVDNWDHILRPAVKNEHLKYIQFLKESYQFRLETQFDEGAIFKLVK